MAINFPAINPIIMPIGPLAISWYSLSYVVGIIVGAYYCKILIEKNSLTITTKQFDDFISYLIIGVIVGGRLGYVLVYDPLKYLSHPINILKTYEGGMSFHGGILGVIISTLIFARRNKVAFFEIADLVSAAAPIGIALGRIANFINCELVGRVTDFSLAVLFPPEFLPRHASQLYESLTEGFLSFFIILFFITKYRILETRMLTSGLFLTLYGTCRVFCEFFREPDIQVGYIFNYITMGQILSTPFIILGITLLCLSSKR
jgi:phosphatidylglycerol:prolipoprotein diacylglycerol transferase